MIASPEIKNAVIDAIAEIVNTKLKFAGAHQAWCSTYGEMLGWNDAEIYRLEPFMIKYIFALRSDIMNQIARLKEPT